MFIVVLLSRESEGRFSGWRKRFGWELVASRLECGPLWPPLSVAMRRDIAERSVSLDEEV